MRTVWKKAAALFLLLLLPLTLAACSEESIAALRADETEELYLALVSCDTTLTHCFVTEGDTTPDLVSKRELHENDVVLVCGSIDNSDEVLVQIPYSDSDNPVYGFLDSACLSETEPTKENANQVVLKNCTTYDAPDGNERDGSKSGSVTVVERQEGWYQVEAISGKWEPYWVKAEDVKFFEAKR